ncbi:MAG: PD40 domain-containing protein [Bacteroidales bacterium]|nr:PD40 domain-containing protein [Candidatus Physcousia equi]
MKKIYAFIITLIVLVGCGKKAELPAQYTDAETQACIFPDYRDVVVPPNIAPLNFQLKDSLAEEAVAELKGEKGETLLVASGDELIMQMDTTAWRKLLQENKGGKIEVTVYAKHGDKWMRYLPHTLTVAEDEIDGFLSYRLIEPGYELYRQLGLYQRNLTNWDVHTIYENNREYSDSNNHCINCHNFQNYQTERMLFHVRAKHGGTVIVENGKAHKVQVKDEKILSAGVYPSWHPKHPWVAFSTNKTGQAFHLYHDERIEVIDEGSDLLFYDVDKNEVKHILCTDDHLETFPNWNPTGDRLYYCDAYVPSIVHVADSMRASAILTKYDSMFYNLMSVSFDEKTRSFGEPEVVVNAAAMRKSITVPRVSPDGRYLLFTMGDYGQFHIWHKSSDLWVKDLQADSCYALTDANSPDVDSYHTWSSNGRWIVFSSRRMDGNYTRPHIAYFDKQGQAHKAFCLPQQDPRHNIMLLKSYNVPELTKDAVRISARDLKDCIYNTEGEKSKYINNPSALRTPTREADTVTGASPKK